MRFSSTIMILTTLFSGYFCIATDANAQQVVYKNENCAPTDFYKPSDPWTRGKLYNIQTGNSGLFFNCDGEQAKRYSPYICWKPITEKALPTRKGIWNSIKQDIAEVKQRVEMVPAVILDALAQIATEPEKMAILADVPRRQTVAVTNATRIPATLVSAKLAQRPLPLSTTPS